MTFLKKRLSLLLLILVVLSATACSAPAPKDPSSPTSPDSSQSSPPVPSSEQPESSSPISPQGDGLKTYTIGGLTFSYPGEVVLTEADSTPYFHFNETSFFFIDSSPMDTTQEPFDEGFAAEYFKAAVASFNQEPWQSATMAKDPTVVDFNGLLVWTGGIETQREGTDYRVIVVLTHYEGNLTSFVLISDIDSFPTSSISFDEILNTITPGSPSALASSSSQETTTQYSYKGLTFTYPENVVLTDVYGTPFFHYNDTSFFSVDSTPHDIATEPFDQALVDNYFQEAVDSFNKGDWKNGTITDGPGMADINGLELWLTLIETEQNGVSFKIASALTYHKGNLITLTFVSDPSSYETMAPSFGNTINSIIPE